MNETAKRSALIVVIVAAVAVAIWQGMAFFQGPKLEYTGKPIGNFSAGHTGKQAMMEATGQSQAK